MAELQRGSIVVCEYDFREERQAYGHPYPHLGECLTVSGSSVHWPSQEVLLTFEELRGKMPIGLAASRFKLVQSMDDGQDIIKEITKLLTK